MTNNRTSFDAIFTSRANYWFGLALDLCASIIIVTIGCATSTSVVSALVAVLAGTVTFTMYEYGLHRWLYHGHRTAVATLHTRHHRDPDVLVGAPFYFSLGVTALNWLPAAWLVDRSFASVFAGMILYCYAQQSVIHHVAHNWPLTNGLGARSALRRHHLLHHHTGGGNFGISTRFWDHVFGTVVTPKARWRVQAAVTPGECQGLRGPPR